MTTTHPAHRCVDPLAFRDSTRKRLGEMLLEAGVITARQLAAALEHQRRNGGKLGQALVRLGIASEDEVVGALSVKLGCAAVGLSQLRGTAAVLDALRLVPREVAERHLLIPIACDGRTITVVMSDPTNVSTIDEIAFRTGRRVVVGFAGEDSIAAAIDRLYGSPADRLKGVGAPRVAEEPPVLSRSVRPDAGRPISLLVERLCESADPAPDGMQLVLALMRALLAKGLVNEQELGRELKTILREPPRLGAPPRVAQCRAAG